MHNSSVDLSMEIKVMLNFSEEKENKKGHKVTSCIFTALAEMNDGLKTDRTIGAHLKGWDLAYEEEQFYTIHTPTLRNLGQSDEYTSDLWWANRINQLDLLELTPKETVALEKKLASGFFDGTK